LDFVRPVKTSRHDLPKWSMWNKLRIRQLQIAHRSSRWLRAATLSVDENIDVCLSRPVCATFHIIKQVTFHDYKY